ncbi:hypothetical protein Ccrd_002122, partial [Cynara cardunculus var. scolymus]
MEVLGDGVLGLIIVEFQSKLNLKSWDSSLCCKKFMHMKYLGNQEHKLHIRDFIYTHKADRGMHLYYLKVGTIEANPHHIVNLVHYEVVNDLLNLARQILRIREDSQFSDL